MKAATTSFVFSWTSTATETFDARRYHGFSQTGDNPNDNAPACVRQRYNVGWDDHNCGVTFGTLCERE